MAGIRPNYMLKIYNKGKNWPYRSELAHQGKNWP